MFAPRAAAPMPASTLTIGLLALLTASAVQAQVYRTTGPDGRTVYTDQPPAASTAPAAGSRAGSNASSGASALPYELSQIAQRYPVTLYTRKNCNPCDVGRTLLSHRGIPFTEKTVESNTDIAAFNGINGGGNAQLPTLTIGQQTLRGFSEQNWTSYLDAAGYPKTSRLPSGYRQAAATPLTEPSAASPTTGTNTSAGSAAASGATTPIGGSTSSEPSIAPPITPDNPTGIRF